MSSLIIGITGGTGSGKATVAEGIVARLNSSEVVIIPQDAYYKDRSHLPQEEREKINYDHPSAFGSDREAILTTMVKKTGRRKGKKKS